MADLPILGHIGKISKVNDIADLQVWKHLIGTNLQRILSQIDLLIGSLNKAHKEGVPRRSCNDANDDYGSGNQTQN